MGTALDSPSLSAPSRAPGAQAAVPRGRKDRLGPCGPCRPSSATRSTAAKGTAGRGAGGHQAGWAASPPCWHTQRAAHESHRKDGKGAARPQPRSKLPREGPGLQLGRGGRPDKTRAHLGMLKPLPGKDSVPTSPRVPGPPVCVYAPPRAAVVASGFPAAVARVGSPAEALLPAASATPTSAPGVAHTRGVALTHRGGRR